MNEHKKMRIWISYLTAIFLMLLMTGCLSANHTLDTGEVQPNRPDKVEKLDYEKSTVLSNGTKVDDLDLSGTQVTEAPAKIESWAKDKLEETRVLLYNEQEIPITLKDMGITVDTEKIVGESQRIPGQAVSSTLKVDSLAASQMLQQKLEKFSRPAKDAFYNIENDKMVIHPAETGRTVAVDQLLSSIQRYPLNEVPAQIELPMKEVPATVTTESLQPLAFDSVIAEFSTTFSANEKNRSSNLAAAAKALDRKAILPGGVFSFNDTVGPREPATGYKDAYIIIEGEYVKGTGGGVCQVSSTLYNAVLLSDLEVLERKPHAMVVSYVPTGQDATVNYPNIDFKFKNNTPGIIYLRTEVTSGQLTVRIWGKKTGKSVRIERQVVKELNFKVERRYDSKLPKGRVVQEQKGLKGMVVNVWQIVREASGQETKRFLGKDSYAPTNRILRIGT